MQVTQHSASHYRLTIDIVFNHTFFNELFADELYSGYMPIKLGDCDVNQEGSFFFWLAKQRNLETSPPPKESLVVWLNGGPGKQPYQDTLNAKNWSFRSLFGCRHLRYHTVVLEMTPNLNMHIFTVIHTVPLLNDLSVKLLKFSRLFSLTSCWSEQELHGYCNWLTYFCTYSEDIEFFMPILFGLLFEWRTLMIVSSTYHSTSNHIHIYELILSWLSPSWLW